MTIRDRRDSFCGKMSVCNNLTQYGIPIFADHAATRKRPIRNCFASDLDWFAAVCRVVRGLRRLRIGAIGARPAAFNTVRYSEKMLEAQRHFRRAHRPFGDPRPHRAHGRQRSLPRWQTGSIQTLRAQRERAAEALMKMAKLGAVIDQWMAQTDVSISAVQCWTSLEEFFGVVPCTVMSMMSENLMSSACEVDICGVIGMHALQLASGTPSALLDWNNNYGDDPDKAVCFHCSNLPKHFFREVRMDFQEIIAGTVGRENTYGTCVGLVKPGPMSFARFSTNDRTGEIHGYLGEGRVHRRSARHLRRRGRGAHSQSARPAALYLRARLRASRSGQPGRGLRVGEGSHHEIPGLVRASAQRELNPALSASPR